MVKKRDWLDGVDTSDPIAFQNAIFKAAKERGGQIVNVSAQGSTIRVTAGVTRNGNGAPADDLPPNTLVKTDDIRKKISELTAPKPEIPSVPPAGGKAKKGGKNKVKYYWRYVRDEEMDGDGDVFYITPKKYFDKYKCLDDSFDSDADLPEGFGNLTESVFEFDGSREEGEALLRADPAFEENDEL